MRTLLVLSFLASLPAWAVGEHIAVTGPAKDQLSETLCISMECAGSNDYIVSSKVVGDEMQLKVTGADGLVRLTLKTPVGPNGRLASSDAMSATSQLVHAIETPYSASKAVAEKVEKKPAKKAKYAKHHVAKPVRVAARMHSPRG
jgi:hypothetical protein